MIRLQSALKKFLKKEATVLGYLPDDRTVSNAVLRQVPFTLYDPNAEISKTIANLASKYENHSFHEEWTLPKRNFLQNMKRYFLGR